jgi:hypothetical protein
MELNRRTFLQRTSLGLLALGSSQTGLSLGVDRYYQTLAEPTPRKLALLVGINEYPDSTSLKGCLTDVELQQELLVHRFGFQAQDILVLTGEQATRDAIERAFLEHLVEQATSGDVVVFHFSGYGRQVKIPETIDTAKEYRLANSLMPSDSILPTNDMPVRETPPFGFATCSTWGDPKTAVDSPYNDGASSDFVNNDLLEETLLLLGRSLATDKLTFVLDTSYCSTGRLLQGNLRVRSFPTLAENPSPEELAVQEQLQRRLHTVLLNKKRGGTILRGARNERVATEIVINGFSAGLFTHTLTQYLWQVEPASRLSVAMTRTAEQMAVAIGNRQEPQSMNGDRHSWLTYYLLPENSLGAEGVIVRLDSDRTVELLLTGLPSNLLAHYELNSCFSILPSPDAGEILLQIRSREGLKAKAKLLQESPVPLQVGQLVRESIRILPRHISLTVALDPSLERIERVDATSAFATIAAVSAAIVAGEQAADCLLGKMRSPNANLETVVASAQANPMVALGWEGYGLFSAGGTILANGKGTASEAVKSAIGRLEPQLQQLLAAKMWRLTVNEGSASLGARATLEIVGKIPQVFLERNTRRQALGMNNLSPLATANSSDETAILPRLPIGTQIQYRLENLSDRPIYFLLLGIDSGGRAIALYAPQQESESTVGEKTAKLKHQCLFPGEQRVIPQPSASGPAGLAEIQVVCAYAPFVKTVAALSAIEYLKGDREQILKLPNPLEVSQALLEDLHSTSAVESKIIGSLTDIYALDTKTWATLSFVYQVM